MNVNMSGLKALGYQQITSLGSATALTVPKGASLAMCQAEAQAVRWRDDGTAPTASVGMPLAVGDTLFFDSAAIAVVQFIQQAASATLNVTFYGPN